jgi:hypothetical protein
LLPCQLGRVGREFHGGVSQPAGCLRNTLSSNVDPCLTSEFCFNFILFIFSASLARGSRNIIQAR